VVTRKRKKKKQESNEQTPITKSIGIYSDGSDEVRKAM